MARLAGALLVCVSLGCLRSCGDDAGVEPGRIDQVRVGFGLNSEGRVSSGCVATTFGVGDPIHFSMQVNDTSTARTVRARVQDTVTSRILWSAEQALPEGRSHVTFAIGRRLPRGRYRAEARFANETTRSLEFVVHDLGQSAPFR